MWSPSILSNGKTVKTLVKILLLELRNGTKLQILPNLSCPLFFSCQLPVQVKDSSTISIPSINATRPQCCHLLWTFADPTFPPHYIPTGPDHGTSLLVTGCIGNVIINNILMHFVGVASAAASSFSCWNHSGWQSQVSSPLLWPLSEYSTSARWPIISAMPANTQIHNGFLDACWVFFFWSFKVWLFGWIRCSQT